MARKAVTQEVRAERGKQFRAKHGYLAAFVPPDLETRVEMRARRLGLSKSEWLREAVERALATNPRAA